MRDLLIFWGAIFFIACNGSDSKVLNKDTVESVQPETTLSPLQVAVQTAILNIEKKDIESNGNTVISIHVDGMEIMEISKKDYYSAQAESQEKEFKSYLAYLEKFEKTNSPINNPGKLAESKQRHNAVMAYLQKMVRTASTEPEIYKVVYYLKAGTKTVQYDQMKTTYLDKDYKKIVANYSFLQKNKP